MGQVSKVMQFNKKAFLAFATIAALGNAQEATAPEDSAVVKLTSATFNDFIKENPLVLAEFYAPWCGHCKNLAPHYVEAAATLQDKGIPLAQIDCTEESELCMEQGIRGYPTLKVFKNNQIDNPSEYQGARSAPAIVSYLIKQSLPPVTVLEGVDAAADLKDLIAEASSALVVDTGVEDLNATFYELADLYRDDFTFVQYTSEDEPKLSIYLPEAEGPISYNGSNLTLSHLVDWVQVETKPYFGEINGETFQSYMSAGLPLAYVFYTSADERASLEPYFIELGKKYRGNMSFVGLDASMFGRHAENLNMKEQFPLFVIHDLDSNLKFGLPQLDEEEFAALEKPLELDTKSIGEFVEKFFAEELTPSVKSEEIPEVQESNVFKIVGYTHEETIGDKDKDVLVKYYAPWCGHCKRLAPIYEELADLYASDEDAKEKILIADVDATLNDVNVEIEGFPTIFLYPAGKSEPVIYQGSRSLESFVEFLTENGQSSINGTALLENKRAEEAKAQEEAEANEEEAEEESEAETAILHDEL